MSTQALILVYLSIGLKVTLFTSAQVYIDLVNPFARKSDTDEGEPEEYEEIEYTPGEAALQDALLRVANMILWPAVLTYLLLALFLEGLRRLK